MDAAGQDIVNKANIMTQLYQLIVAVCKPKLTENDTPPTYSEQNFDDELNIVVFTLNSFMLSALIIHKYSHILQHDSLQGLIEEGTQRYTTETSINDEIYDLLQKDDTGDSTIELIITINDWVQNILTNDIMNHCILRCLLEKLAGEVIELWKKYEKPVLEQRKVEQQQQRKVEQQQQRKVDQQQQQKITSGSIEEDTVLDPVPEGNTRKRANRTFHA